MICSHEQNVHCLSAGLRPLQLQGWCPHFSKFPLQEAALPWPVTLTRACTADQRGAVGKAGSLELLALTAGCSAGVSRLDSSHTGSASRGALYRLASHYGSHAACRASRRRQGVQHAMTQPPHRNMIQCTLVLGCACKIKAVHRLGLPPELTTQVFSQLRFAVEQCTKWAGKLDRPPRRWITASGSCGRRLTTSACEPSPAAQ